jgi:hypothetical protein
MEKLIGIDEDGNFITRPLTPEENQKLIEAINATAPTN